MPDRPPPTPLVDGFGRVHRDLRISVTDRCNFRCDYCMPAEGMDWLPRQELLTFEEITRVARLQSQTVDFATSNVKGTPIPVFVAGSEIVNNFPLGPLGGVAFNLTLLSHVGSLDMGLNMDAGAVTHPEVMRDCLNDAFADLVNASRTKKRATGSQRAKK